MSDLYGFAETVTINQFRDRTAKHAKMAGVTLATFVCKSCGKQKPTDGCRWVSKHRRDGRICADCAPAAEDVPPVALVATSKGKVPAEPKKPAKAPLMTDSQVLECREAHEFEGVRPDVLARRYGVKLSYMRQLLDYAVRSKLIPARYRK